MRKGLWYIIVVTILASVFLSSCYRMDYDFDISACEVDDDCVRQDSCCDCSLGEYINKQYYKPANCKDECDCVADLSIGMCIEDSCEAIPIDEEYCDEAGRHRLGDTWEEDGKPCTCLRGRVIDCGTDEQKETKADAQKSLDTYYDTIDYSCTTNADCEIKDIHNCCGYFPKCVNKNFAVLPDQVSAWCADAEAASVCGFPTINNCECQDGTCVGII